MQKEKENNNNNKTVLFILIAIIASFAMIRNLISDGEINSDVQTLEKANSNASTTRKGARARDRQ